MLIVSYHAQQFGFAVAPLSQKMSLATAGIYCTTSLPLSRVTEDSSIVQVQQLQILYRQRCPHHNLQRMFGTLWNV